MQQFHPRLRRLEGSFPGLRSGLRSGQIVPWMVFGLAGVLMACQASPPPPDRLKIGTLLPITGDLSQYGSAMQDTARLAIDTANACGGVLGQPVDLVAADDQTDPAAAVAATTKLLESDRVAALVGGASSSVASATIGLAVRHQAVMVSPSSTSPSFTDRARQGEFKGFWFRTAPADTFQGIALAKLAKTQGYKTVAVLAVNNDYGNGLLSAFIPAFEQLGGTVINRDKPTRYPPDSSTFDTVVNEAFRKTPDAVVLVAYPETGSLILKAAYQQGLLGKGTDILATDGMREAKVADLAGQNRRGDLIAAGLMGTAPSPGGPALQAFQTQYEQKFKRSPKVFDANTWDATVAIILAAEAARSFQGPAIRDALRQVANPPGERITDLCTGLQALRTGQKINYQGASGNLDFTPEGDITGSYEIWTIQADGTLGVIGAISVDGLPAGDQGPAGK
jgi:ABC-type branched-subunit amino acid transport system substrate-binding protein